jgi:peptide/nickel transport system substrate-binding protein
VAIDKLTVKITLKELNAPFIEGVEMCFLGIVSKADIESRGAVEAFTDQPVTSGPYKVAKWKPNDRLILEPNPYYWREGFPKNDGVELIEVMDSNTSVAMLQSGDVDVVQGLTWAQAINLDSHPEITVTAEPATRIWSINLNHGRPPFNDIRVRQAAALALDRELITRVITRGYARVANTVVPDTLMFHHSDYVGLPYDMERAKNLIREAGVEGQEVFINIVAPGGSFERVAIILQAQWAEIGLRTTIVKMDAAMENQRMEDGDYDASVNWWYNENSDPDLAMKWAVCSSCGSHAYFTWYQSAEADRLIAEGSRTLDTDKRRKIYYRIQEIATDELAQIPLFYPDWINGYSKDIEGLSLSPSLQWSLEYAHHVQ